MCTQASASLAPIGKSHSLKRKCLRLVQIGASHERLCVSASGSKMLRLCKCRSDMRSRRSPSRSEAQYRSETQAVSYMSYMLSSKSVLPSPSATIRRSHIAPICPYQPKPPFGHFHHMVQGHSAGVKERRCGRAAVSRPISIHHAKYHT